MSSISSHHGHGSGHGGNGEVPSHHDHHHHDEPHVAARKHLDLSLVTMREGSGRTLGLGLMFLGVLSCAVVVIGALAGGKAGVAQGLGAYHTGVIYALGIMLGCLGTQMIFQQVNAGWAAAVRRQAENIASLAWVVAILFAPIFVLELFVTKGTLFSWMDTAHVAHDPVYQHKAGFLNAKFWGVRAVLYFVIWTWLGTSLFKLSRRQDETGDKWITAKSRFMSSYGLLLFALTTAFASFDWVMSLDYHWFSTMFGVYYFAGSIVSSTAVLAVILTTLRIKGKLGPTFTKEHQHDLGKLLFAFTVFWAYITLCQYFLIWYSNIPEETAFYAIRKEGVWRYVGMAVCFGHFALPFLFLLIRDFKRNPHTLRLAAVWMLVMHAVDLMFMIRPEIERHHGVKLGVNPWIDLFGILGPVCLLMGMAVFKLVSVPLVPIKDPRLHEVLHHKNYV